MNSVTFDKTEVRREDDGTVEYEVLANGIPVGSIWTSLHDGWWRTSKGTRAKYASDAEALEELYQTWIREAVH